VVKGCTNCGRTGHLAHACKWRHVYAAICFGAFALLGVLLAWRG
jgi:hypothetical protein